MKIWEIYNKLSAKDRTEYWYRIGIWKFGMWIPLILLYFYLVPIFGNVAAGSVLNATTDKTVINMYNASIVAELSLLLIYALFFLIMEIGITIGERVWLIQKGYRKTMFEKEDSAKNLRHR